MTSKVPFTDYLYNYWNPKNDFVVFLEFHTFERVKPRHAKENTHLITSNLKGTPNAR